MNIFQKAGYFLVACSGYVVTKASYNDGKQILAEAEKAIQSLSDEFLPDTKNSMYFNRGVLAADTGCTTIASVEDWDWLEMRVPTKGLSVSDRDELLSNLAKLTGLQPNGNDEYRISLESEKLGVYYEGGSPVSDVKTIETNKRVIKALPKIVENFTKNCREIEELISAARERATPQNPVTSEDMAAIAERTNDSGVAVAPKDESIQLG